MLFSFVGESYHGVTGKGKKKKSFTIQVYPFGNAESRCQEICSKIVENIPDSGSLNTIKNGKKKFKNNSKLKTKPIHQFGHMGM